MVAFLTCDPEVAGSSPGRDENFPPTKIALTTVLNYLRLCEYVVSDMMESGVSTGVSKLRKHVRCADRHDITSDVESGVKPYTNKNKSNQQIRLYIR